MARRIVKGQEERKIKEKSPIEREEIYREEGKEE